MTYLFPFPAWAGRARNTGLVVALAALVALPAQAGGLMDCVERVSRIPTAAPVPSPADRPLRANMFRMAPTAEPAPPTRPRAMRAAKTRPAGVQAEKPRPKASSHKPKRRKPAAAQRAAPRPTPTAAPARPMPTPMAVAAAKLATPVSYALIRTTVCEALPGPIPPGAFRPPLSAPSPEDDEWPPGGGIPSPPPLEPEDIWPGMPPPPVTPPVGPPVTAVPEPGTWALMILGFGLLGSRLRARRAMAP